MAAGIITYVTRVNGRVKPNGVIVFVEQEPTTETMEAFLTTQIAQYNPTAYLISYEFDFINDRTKARICAEG
jgi:hypothetical protein